MSNEVRERLNDFVVPTGEMFLRMINFLTHSTNQHNWAKNLRNGKAFDHLHNFGYFNTSDLRNMERVKGLVTGDTDYSPSKARILDSAAVQLGLYVAANMCENYYIANILNDTEGKISGSDDLHINFKDKSLYYEMFLGEKMFHQPIRVPYSDIYSTYLRIKVSKDELICFAKTRQSFHSGDVSNTEFVFAVKEDQDNAEHMSLRVDKNYGYEYNLNPSVVISTFKKLHDFHIPGTHNSFADYLTKFMNGIGFILN